MKNLKRKRILTVAILILILKSSSFSKSIEDDEINNRDIITIFEGNAITSNEADTNIRNIGTISTIGISTRNDGIHSSYVKK